MSAEDEIKLTAAPPRRRHWSAAEVWMLGLFSIVGLAGFAATFVLIVMRPPAEPPAQRTLTPTEIRSLAGPRGEPGPAGPSGPAGPRGPAGDSTAVRVLRADCSGGNCVVECADDEILLSAFCSPNRGPVTYPAEHSASCRPSGRARVEVVGACIKARR